MTENPGLVIRRGADAPGGAMVISEAAVMRRVNAYNKFANETEDLVLEIKTSTHISTYGNLDSLRQVAENYYDLMVTGDESLVGRLTQFSNQARQIAAKLLSDWQEIKDEDAATRLSLNAAGPQ